MVLWRFFNHSSINEWEYINQCCILLTKNTLLEEKYLRFSHSLLIEHCETKGICISDLIIFTIMLYHTYIGYKKHLVDSRFRMFHKE